MNMHDTKLHRLHRLNHMADRDAAKRHHREVPPPGPPDLLSTLRQEASRTRDRYLASLRDLAHWTARNPEAVAVMLAEVAALDNGLQAVREVLL